MYSAVSAVLALTIDLDMTLSFNLTASCGHDPCTLQMPKNQGQSKIRVETDRWTNGHDRFYYIASLLLSVKYAVVSTYRLSVFHPYFDFKTSRSIHASTARRNR